MLIRYLLRSKVLALFFIVAIPYSIKHYFFGPSARELLFQDPDPFQKIEVFFSTLIFKNFKTLDRI
jgi:hypothetical protein